MITSDNTSRFMQLVRSPLRFKLFLIKRLPLAFFAGLRVAEAEPQMASVTISLGYLTKNPFQSIYFACLAMAAEMSAGILAMNAIEQTGQPFSILVTGLEAQFIKKANGTITFECTDGTALVEAVQHSSDEKIPGTFTTQSTGTNDTGQTVATFTITWSFKPKDIHP